MFLAINQSHLETVKFSIHLWAQPLSPHLVAAATIHTLSKAVGCCGAELGLAEQVEGQGNMRTPEMQQPGLPCVRYGAQHSWRQRAAGRGRMHGVAARAVWLFPNLVGLF